MLGTIPESISTEQGRLQIDWKDGKRCSYDLLALRRNCPCAVCRGGHEAQARRTTGKITAIELRSWKKVGRYALQLNWSDGHETGIYTYDLLRQACEEGREYQPPDER